MLNLMLDDPELRTAMQSDTGHLPLRTHQDFHRAWTSRIRSGQIHGSELGGLSAFTRLRHFYSLKFRPRETCVLSFGFTQYFSGTNFLPLSVAWSSNARFMERLGS